MKTWPFLLLTLSATILFFVCIVWNRSVTSCRAMAHGFYLLSGALSFAALLYILSDVFGVLPHITQYVVWLQILIYRGWLVIGVGISSALLIGLNVYARPRSRVANDTTRCLITSPYLLNGLCLSVSLSFICTEVGKLAHDSEMRQFFVQSGYPVWFLYFTILAEAVGAIGLLVSKTELPAAIGLAIIMMGAIGTHFHNRDRFSDSLEAVHLLTLLACVVGIRLLRGKVVQEKGVQDQEIGSHQ